MRKTIAIILSLLMTFGIACCAFADGVDVLDDDAVVRDNEAVRFEKEITVYNPDNATVNEPTASYTYTITAGSSAKMIKDGNGKQAATKQGVLTGIRMSSQTTPTAATATSITLTYAPNSGTTMSASQTGAKNSKWVEIDFNEVVFGAAGVYRYVIEESNYTYTTNGVVEGTTNHTRYLDVYVKDAEEQSAEANLASDWDVYGYAMFTTDDGIDATVSPAETKKTTGFVTHYDGDPTDESKKKTADSYYTFNFTLQKTVNNDSYIKSTHHQFPFTVTLSNTTVTANVLPIMTVSANATQTALNSSGIVIGSAVWTPTIADGATVTYVGIPAGTTITINETNDVTGAAYEVSSSGADTELSSQTIYSGSTSGNATVSVGATAGAAVTNNKTVVFTNNLAQISPTGYVSRYAPYALILVAGVILLVLAKKRKKDTEEE